ncbi:hypothetical protein O3P69_015864 [Scylla paramamosain]|uniref:G-protein coupled receptors family 3 profile domain-containing protein n=1 Tax=Scylla paramamosain TaxID=85552 RepID=A0AAW0TAF3_SCYPA
MARSRAIATKACHPTRGLWKLACGDLCCTRNEAEVEGTLSVQPQANPVGGFDDYFLSLTVEKNKRNPWFVEYWENHFGCRYPNSSLTPYNAATTRECTGAEQLTAKNTQFEAQLQFVSDAVMAFAYAFRNMHRDLCEGRGLCPAMNPTDGEKLLSYLRQVTFTGLSGDRFKFDDNGDGPARYNIIHFKQVSQGRYAWTTVGTFIEGKLRLNMSELQFKLDEQQPPSSVCSLPCLTGQAKKYVEGESCCWHCFNCSTYQIVNPRDETQCFNCAWGTLPDADHLRCNPIPEVYIRPDSWWAVGAMVFSSAGVVVTGMVVWVFVRYHDTPVVRASGRELSFVLLSGVFLCYAITFVLVLKRFGLGFCFAVIYSALLTKTNRIARIFNAGKRTTKRPSFISPRSQLCICSCGVFVQVVVTSMWSVVSPPRAIHHYLVREDNFLVCAASINASYVIAFAYPIGADPNTFHHLCIITPKLLASHNHFIPQCHLRYASTLTTPPPPNTSTPSFILTGLIIVCTVYAVLTRKIPEAFNESKHIGFTMYTTCIIWLAFVPIYFTTANNVELRFTVTSVTVSLSATVALVCLFTPKLYIILLHPERNVRQSMMANYSTVRSTLSSSSQRVDSATQSEVFPLDYELHEKLRTMSAGQLCSSSQTCPGSCPLPEHRCGPAFTLTPSAATPAFNGPVQDVPDVLLLLLLQTLPGRRIDVVVTPPYLSMDNTTLQVNTKCETLFTSIPTIAATLSKDAWDSFCFVLNHFVE